MRRPDSSLTIGEMLVSILCFALSLGLFMLFTGRIRP